jgi:hypothetical protein
LEKLGEDILIPRFSASAAVVAASTLLVEDMFNCLLLLEDAV